MVAAFGCARQEQGFLLNFGREQQQVAAALGSAVLQIRPLGSRSVCSFHSQAVVMISLMRAGDAAAAGDRC